MMPLALYLVAALALLWAVRVRGRAAAVLLLLPLCVTGRAILTGRVYAPIDIAFTSEPLASMARAAGADEVANPALSDVFAQFIPWHDAVRYALAHRQWPLWNPFELCGDPLAGAMQSAPYHPIHLLAYLLPLGDDLTFTATMVLFLAALSAFLFLRDLVSSTLAALIGAAAWMLSTHLVTFLGTAHGMALAGLPLLLLGARRVAIAPSIRSAALLTAALLLLVFAGHPETMLHCVALAGVYFLWSAGVPPAGPPASRRLVFALGAGIAALLLSAFFLLPFLEVLPQTAEYRFRLVNPVHQQSARFSRITHELAAEAMPYIDGLSGFERREHARAIRHSPVGSAYAGAILFAPAVFALWRGRGRERWFFAGALAWGLLAGANAPGVTHLLHALPGFSIAVNDRMIVFAALAIAVLAAMGVEALECGGNAAAFASLYAAIALLIAIAVVIQYPALIRDGLTAGFLRVSAIRQIVPMLLAAAGLIAFRRQTVPLLLLALLLTERGAELSRRPIVEQRAVYPPFAGLEILPRGGEPYRVVGAGTMLPPNIATHYRLEDARGYQAMTFGLLEETFPLWSKRQSVWSNRVDDLGAPMLSLMNVRYALASPRVPLPEGWEWRARLNDYGIAENLRALPRAFVPAAIHAELPLWSVRDFAAEGWVEGAAAKGVNGPGLVTARWRGTHLKLHASMMGAGWIVITEAAWKGWRATVDGKSVRVHVGDHAFLAVYVPQGEHDVTLFYRPRGFVVGSWLSGIALLLAIGLAIRARARPSPASCPATPLSSPPDCGADRRGDTSA